ncbi:class I tRNA ligase family protein, partial [Candidatus Babeliales bacterium]|nr:class I tRNA ligase family protein [Candidatus Babeliales bacterium]
LKRLWVYVTNQEHLTENDVDVKDSDHRLFHSFMKDYQERLNDFKVNTAVASAMEFLNHAQAQKLVFSKKMLQEFLTSLSIMVPHLASELLDQLLNIDLKNCRWPSFDPALTIKSSLNIAIQINGKLRTTITVSTRESEETITAKASTAAQRWLENKTIIKRIFVKNRLINFVVKG